MTREEWRDVKGYEDHYKVSNTGKVVSFQRNKTGHILSPSIGKDGYLRIGLRSFKKDKTYTIHNLVCMNFIGERPEGFDINHKDHNKHNNNVDNLEYISRQENIKHAVKNNLYLVEENHPKVKLNKEQVLEIRDIYKQGSIGYRVIGKMFSVHRSTVRDIVNMKIWPNLKRASGETK